jgi:hypothetical protein
MSMRFSRSKKLFLFLFFLILTTSSVLGTHNIVESKTVGDSIGSLPYDGFESTPIYKSDKGEGYFEDFFGKVYTKNSSGQYVDWNGKVVEGSGPDDGSPNAIANFIGWILFWIASFFSKLVGWLVTALVYIASYNNFLNHNIVKTGWQIVRDVCNNFFIVGLLVISVATILRQPASYQYQQALGKLLIMAVLINFSKLFTGILIDVSQVITIYFANALGSKGEAIILYSLGLYDLYQNKGTENDTWDQYGTAVYALLFALLLSVVAAVVICAILLVLIWRIVTLWFLVILSPAAFLAKAIPGQEKYFSEWFSTLSKELIVAPVMLFFLYLSLFAGAVNVNDSNDPNGKNPTVTGTPGQSAEQATSGINDNFRITSLKEEPEKLVNFLLIIGLLVGSLVAGQRVGAKGSSWAGAGVAKLDGWRKKGVGFVRDKTIDKAKSGAWSVASTTGATIKGLDAALLGGYGARGVNRAKAIAKGGVNVTGSAAGGAVVGGLIGTAMGPIGTLLGAKLGAAAGGAIGSFSQLTAQRRAKARRDNDAQVTAESEKEKGSVINEDGKAYQDIKDEKGNIINSLQNQIIADMRAGKSIGRYDDTLGGYVKFKLGANGREEIQRDFAMDSNRKEIKNNQANAPQFLDSKGNPSSAITSDGYVRQGDGRYRSVNAARMLDSEGKEISRFGEYKDAEGNVYRKSTADGSYHKTNARGQRIDKDGKLLSDDDLVNHREKLVAAKRTNILPPPVQSDEVKGGMWKMTQRYLDAYNSGTHKGVIAEQAATDEKITKEMKGFDGMSKEMLQRLLEIEKDSAKRQAVALTLGVKAGFKDSDQVNVAKDLLRGNQLLMKKFDESMNKKNMVMNNTRKDGTLDESKVERLVTNEETTWKSQAVKQMTPEAFDLMARMEGVKFAPAVDSMIHTTADKTKAASILGKNVKNRGFSGSDESIRKMYGALSNQWNDAFTNPAGEVELNALASAMRGITKTAVWGTVDKSHFEDDAKNDKFKLAAADTLLKSRIKQMQTNDDVTQETLRGYVKLLRQVAAGSIPGSNIKIAGQTKTPQEKAIEIIRQLGDEPATRSILDLA